MSLVTWRDDFRTGVAEVDEEHQGLIELINTLHEETIRDRTSDRVEAFLGEIFTKISAHFALEEKVMRSRQYPALAEHKADHERLLDDIRAIMDSHAEEGIVDDAAFSARLSEWFGRHFQTHDARLHGWQTGRS